MSGECCPSGRPARDLSVSHLTVTGDSIQACRGCIGNLAVNTLSVNNLFSGDPPVLVSPFQTSLPLAIPHVAFSQLFGGAVYSPGTSTALDLTPVGAGADYLVTMPAGNRQVRVSVANGGINPVDVDIIVNGVTYSFLNIVPSGVILTTPVFAWAGGSTILTLLHPAGVLGGGTLLFVETVVL